jgi:DNA-binding HxlR family transcriptional regulator
MMLFKKKTFKEMVASDEGVATNLLAARLKLLESLVLITKRKLPNNKKENVYLLTQRGIDLAPIILELVVWSDKHVRNFNPGMNAHDSGNDDRMQIIERVQKEYREFVSLTIN